MKGLDLMKRLPSHSTTGYLEILFADFKHFHQKDYRSDFILTTVKCVINMWKEQLMLPKF
jgi:hypothetical protein